MSNDVLITSMLELSTAHISSETDKLLASGQLDLVFYEKGALDKQVGWWLLVPDEDHRSLPDDLNAIFALAKERNCAWVMLDRDYDIVESLPVYDW